MMLNKEHVYPIVHWKEYLDPTRSIRVEKFINSNGTQVFSSLIDKIREAHSMNSEAIVILVHPNVSALSIVKQDEFISVLNHCLLFFKSKEDYLKCAEIVKLKLKINKPKKVKSKK